MKTVAFKLMGSAMIAFMLFSAAATPGHADERVYVRYNDGRVIYVPRERVTTYTTNGGVIINTLPTTYVSEPYTITNGNNVYYTNTYWHTHKKHWKNDPDGKWRH